MSPLLVCIRPDAGRNAIDTVTAVGFASAAYGQCVAYCTFTSHSSTSCCIASSTWQPMSRPLLCVCLVLSERVCNDLFCKDPHVAKQVWHSKPAMGSRQGVVICRVYPNVEYPTILRVPYKLPFVEQSLWQDSFMFSRENVYQDCRLFP